MVFCYWMKRLMFLKLYKVIWGLVRIYVGLGKEIYGNMFCGWSFWDCWGLRVVDLVGK